MYDEKHKAWYVTTSSVAWIALIAAIIAIVISVVAFNRADENINKVVKQEMNQYQEGVNDAAIRAKVNAELLALRTRIEAAQAGDAIAGEVSDARKNIMSAYDNASDGLKQQSQEVNKNLQQVETDVRSNTAKGLQDLEGIINGLQQDVRTNKK